MPSTTLPPTTRAALNASLAHSKATSTYVYISGLSGHHTLEVGLAYYYRGHYIYAYPAGTLIEPIPYSTRKGIMIQGIVSPSAPEYHRGAEDLVEEGSVEALRASIRSESEALKRLEADRMKETEDVLAGEAGRSSGADASRRPSLPTPAMCSLQGPSSALPLRREGALPPFTPQHGLKWVAASAPGSRLASTTPTPLASRAPSPTSKLRPNHSSLGLSSLSRIRGRPPPSLKRFTKLTPFPETIPSNIPSRSVSVTYLPGLGDHALLAGDAGEGGKGGKRTAPCVIHGGECDGVFTAEKWLTAMTVENRGFVEEVPWVCGGGRVMVDWVGLLEEVGGAREVVRL